MVEAGEKERDGAEAEKAEELRKLSRRWTPRSARTALLDLHIRP